MQKAVVDSVLKSAVGKIADEVAGLLGEEFTLSAPQSVALTKAGFFEIPRDKCAYTRLSANGDFAGEAGVVAPLKDAVLLGGTLIMLPDDEIAEKVKNPELDGEEGDAFGEIGNILVGALTSTFEELFPKKLHFKKTGTEVLIPTKVDLDSDQPFAPGHLHVTSCAMKLAGKPLGNLELVFPFPLLGLTAPEPAEAAPAAPAPVEKSVVEKKEAAAATPAEQAATRQAEGSSAEEKRAAAQVAGDGPAAETAADAPPAPEPAAAGSVARKVADNVLTSAFKEVAKDLGDLIGRPIKCLGPTFQPVTKAEYLALPREKGALAHMVASGDSQGTAYIIVRQKDAIYLGGTLIMLPEDELDAKVKTGDFAGEEGDAYGEVANIITGSLAKVFGEQYPRSLHLKRTEVEPLIPTRVDADGPAPFAPGEYYLASCRLALENKSMGELDLLFPVSVLDLKPDQPQTAADAPTEKGEDVARSEAQAGAGKERAASHSSAISADDLAALRAAATATETDDEDGGEATVVVLAESGDAGALFDQALDTRGIPHRVLAFQDNFKQIINGHKVSGIFLVMNSVGEQGFATAIKVKSAVKAGIPLIMAGPEWTRSSVLKAVRYGACDILVTPATADEITQKVDKHLKAAATSQ